MNLVIVKLPLQSRVVRQVSETLIQGCLNRLIGLWVDPTLLRDTGDWGDVRKWKHNNAQSVVFSVNIRIFLGISKRQSLGQGEHSV